MDTIETITARMREAKRRENLFRQIGVLRAKLDKIGPNPIGLTRERAWRLWGKLKRLNIELGQLELPL